MNTLDLREHGLRHINSTLQQQAQLSSNESWTVTSPQGQHAIACGLDGPLDVTIDGHVGFYCAGMNKLASIRVHGHAGVGLCENMMSGTVRVSGNASQAAGATARGGLLVIEGDASSRCGISLKGADIVVGGNVGHMSAFMAQKGSLVVCGDAGESLGDSIFETRLYVRGKVESLGSDCIEKKMTPHHLEKLARLLELAGMDADPADFRRYGSARKLYNFHIDDA